MAKNDEAGKWLRRIKSALKYRDSVKREQGWDRFIDEYQGRFRVALWSGTTTTQAGATSSQVPPINLVYGYIQSMVPSLYARNPFISVNAKGVQWIERSHILEHVVNYLFRELNVKDQAIKALIDTLLVGHGWLKYGYAGDANKAAAIVRERQKDGGPYSEDRPLLTQDEIELARASGAGDTDYMRTGEIFVSHVPWEDVIFDVAMSKDPPHDCRWIAHRLVKPLDEVKKSPLYTNTAKLKSNIAAQNSNSPTGATERDASRAEADNLLRDVDYPLVEIWEIWDRESKSIFTVADGHDGFLRDDPNPYDMRGLPFSMLRFNEVPGKPYALSDIYLIEPQILELIKLRAQQLNHVKRFNRQLSVEKGSVNRQEMAKFEMGIDGSVIEREKGSAPIVPIEYAPSPPELFGLNAIITQDMDAVIGQTSYDRGGQPQVRPKNLGEIAAQLSGVRQRSARRADRVEDFLEEVATKLIELLKQFQDSDRYIRISGKTPEEVQKAFGEQATTDGDGFYFTAADIQGDYDVEAKAGSMVPLTKETRLNLLEGILRLGPTIGIMPGGIVARAIGKEILRELEIKEAEKAYEMEDAAMRMGMQPPGLGSMPGARPPGGPRQRHPRKPPTPNSVKGVMGAIGGRAPVPNGALQNRGGMI